MGAAIPDDRLFDTLSVDEGQDFEQEWYDILMLFVTPSVADAVWPASASPEISPASPGGLPEAHDGARFPAHPGPDGPATPSPHRMRATGRRRRGAARARRRARALRAASRRETTPASPAAPDHSPKRHATHCAVPNRESRVLRSGSRILRVHVDTTRTTSRWPWPGRASSNGPPRAGRAEPPRSRGPVPRGPIALLGRDVLGDVLGASLSWPGTASTDRLTRSQSSPSRYARLAWRPGLLGSNGTGSSARAISRHSGARKSRLRAPSRAEAAETHSRSMRSSCSTPRSGPSGAGASSAEFNLEAWNRCP